MACLFFSFLFFLIPTAFAETIPAAPGDPYPAVMKYANYYGTAYYDSPEAGCAGNAGSAVSSYVTFSGVINYSNGVPVSYRCDHNTPAYGYRDNLVVFRCVNGGSKDTSGNGQGTCSNYLTCPDDSWTLTGTECTREDCAVNTISSAGQYTGVITIGPDEYINLGESNPFPQSLCDGHCVGNVDQEGPSAVLQCYGEADASPENPKPTWCIYRIKLTGQTCEGTGKPEDNGAPPPIDPCYSQGKKTGEINGVTVCGEDVPITKDQSTTTKPGETTSSSSSDPDNPGPGESKESSKTTCIGDKCTTVITTTTCDDQGNCTGTSKTTEQGKGQYCEKNPNDASCQIGKWTANDCKTAPVCQGDAIQCAQAREIKELKCAMITEPEDDVYKLGKLLAEGGQDPAYDPNAEENVREVNISEIIAEEAGKRFISGQCIQSPTFSIGGRSFTLDVTPFCGFLVAMGYVMVAVASVVAIRMVVSS
jgi:hypothetical protein